MHEYYDNHTVMLLHISHIIELSNVESTHPCTLQIAKGAFGNTTAGYIIAECTQRGDLHDHALLHGLLNPQMISQWCHMPETEAALMELIDQSTSTRLPCEYRSRNGDEWKRLPRMMMREPPKTTRHRKPKPRPTEWTFHKFMVHAIPQPWVSEVVYLFRTHVTII